jgi:CelD/BcsL family acetyltransferase involved in cellulose biosynthesis
MDDLHGIVAARNVALDLSRSDVTRHLGGYAFAAAPASQRRHGVTGQYGDGNQVMDLSNGYEAWLEERQAASSNFRREHRKIETLLDDPDTHVQHDVTDPQAFERLIELKQRAYEQSGHFKLFTLTWPQRLLETLARQKSADARGVLSTLHIKGELAAVAFCMRSERVMHYWFPAYEDKFAKQKPGLALLFSLAEWAATEGLRELHLGLGDTRYKRQLASWMAPVRAGTLALSAPQKFATACTALSFRLEHNHRLLTMPAKLARKYQRVMLAGTFQA